MEQLHNHPHFTIIAVVDKDQWSFHLNVMSFGFITFWECAYISMIICRLLQSQSLVTNSCRLGCAKRRLLLFEIIKASKGQIPGLCIYIYNIQSLWTCIRYILGFNMPMPGMKSLRPNSLTPYRDADLFGTKQLSKPMLTNYPLCCVNYRVILVIYKSLSRADLALSLSWILMGFIMKPMRVTEPWQRQNTGTVIMMKPIINACSSGFDLYHKLPIWMYINMA